MSRRKKTVHRIRESIESIANTRRPASLFSMATVLSLLSIVYGAVMVIRARLYKKGLLTSRSLPCRLVSIGNIAAGGTGKTPMTIHVAQTIKDLGYHVVVISRGYKGRMEHSGGVVSDGRNVLHGPADAGDEPYLMATALTGIPVVVGGDRYQAGRLAIRRFAPDVIVLDDAFQHLRLKRDIDVVLLDRRFPLGNGHLLPRGRLREPVSALRRAHALVFTRCDDMACGHPLPPALSHRPAFHSRHVPIVQFIPSGDDPATCEKTDFAFLRGKKAVAFSGLADNHQFFDGLQQGGCRIVHRFAFGDHHLYSHMDVDLIFEQAVAKGAQLLITTAKDWVKVKHLTHWPMAVAAVDVRIAWLENSDAFRVFLRKVLAGGAPRP